MSFRSFFRDRLPAVFITLAAAAVTAVFLYAFHAPLAGIVSAAAIMLISALCCMIWDFMRRKDFYIALTENAEQLDKKYLIGEVTELPDHLEGQLVTEALREAGKSMYEDVAEHRRSNVEFREFIEMWVHEIKLPVASLELMCHNDGSERYSEQLRRIDEYIETVLFYARSGSEEKDYVIKETQLSRVFSDTALRHREELQMRGVSINTDLLNVTVTTDSKWLEFILGQLMGNSLKYLSPDREPELTVTAEEFPESTVLHFRDNGIGIPAADLPYIFDKSFTGSNGRTHSGSTGMGLYIVKKLCSRLGHGISAQSVQGEYTEISIAFGKNELYKPDITKM